MLVGIVSGWVVLTIGLASAYEASRGPTELVYWDPHKTYSGYTMVKPQRVQGVYLIDMAGQVAHYWPDFGDAYLQEDGTVFGSVGNRTFAIQDWEGETLWEYPEQREGYNPHHDFLRMYNAELDDYTILYIANAPLTHDEVIALGGDLGCGGKLRRLGDGRPRGGRPQRHGGLGMALPGSPGPGHRSIEARPCR